MKDRDYLIPECDPIERPKVNSEKHPKGSVNGKPVDIPSQVNPRSNQQNNSIPQGVALSDRSAGIYAYSDENAALDLPESDTPTHAVTEEANAAAQAEAKRIVEEAEKQAKKIVSGANAEAERIRQTAENSAKQTKEAAERQGDQIIADAKKENDRLTQANAELTKQFNDLSAQKVALQTTKKRLEDEKRELEIALPVLRDEYADFEEKKKQLESIHASTEAICGLAAKGYTDAIQGFGDHAKELKEKVRKECDNHLKSSNDAFDSAARTAQDTMDTSIDNAVSRLESLRQQIEGCRTALESAVETYKTDMETAYKEHADSLASGISNSKIGLITHIDDELMAMYGISAGSYRDIAEAYRNICYTINGYRSITEDAGDDPEKLKEALLNCTSKLRMLRDDLSRRFATIGLLEYSPKPGDEFDPGLHDLYPGEPSAPAGSKITSVFCSGFEFASKRMEERSSLPHQVVSKAIVFVEKEGENNEEA